MIKKIIAFLLIACMVFSLSACGKEIATNKGTGHIKDGVVFKGGSSNEEAVELGRPDSELDPKSVYDKLTYTPEMFYGTYRITGGKKAEEKFGEESNYFKWNRDGKEIEFTNLPFQINAGKKTFNNMVNYVEGYNWMQLYFMRRYDGGSVSLDFITCAYTIEGKKIIFKPLNTFNYDEATKKITYTFTDEVWEYDFAFRGRTLTLSKGDESVELKTCLDAYGEKDYFFSEGYLSPESKSANNIDYIRFLNNAESKTNQLGISLIDGTRSYNSIAVLQENGLFTFTLALEDSKETYQYVCFCGGYDGLVLTDGTETYYYNDTYSDRNKQNVSKYLTEDQTGKLDDLSENELKEIAEKSANMLEDLAKAYQQEGLSVNVNKQTGEIAMDSTVLFGVNESAISDEGKTFLKKFMEVYTSVVFSEKYENFVSKIMVEGHTDTNGAYELNQQLSKARADSVKEYCLSADCGVDSKYIASLQQMFDAVGYSYDKPILNDKGEVDMAASRRVSFRFIINIDKQ